MYFKRSNVQIQIRNKTHLFNFRIPCFRKPLWEYLSRSTFLVRSERFPPKVPAPTSQFGATRPYLDPAHSWRWDIPSSNLAWSCPPRAHQFFQPVAESGDRKPCQFAKSKQFLFLIHSQIGHLSLYFYKLHTQHEDTIEANITNNLHKLHVTH